MRKKKTPEELAAEAEAANQDEFTSETFILKTCHKKNIPFFIKKNIICKWNDVYEIDKA